MKLFERMVEQFIELNKRAKRQKRVRFALAAVVALVTINMLILPAITLDRNRASQEPGLSTSARARASEGTVLDGNGEAGIADGSGGAGDNNGSGGDSGNGDSGDNGDNNGTGDTGGQNGDGTQTGDTGNTGDSSQTGDSGDGTQTGDTGDSGDGTQTGDTGNTGDSSQTGNTGETSQTSSTGSTAQNGEDALNSDEDASGEQAQAGASLGATLAQTQMPEEAAEEVELITEETELSYTDEDETYKVYVRFDEAAKLPVGVQLQVSEILPGGSGPGIGKDSETTYDEYIAQAEDVLNLEKGSASFVRLFDINLLDRNGAKVMIAAPVDVRIELPDFDMRKASNTHIVHFAEKYEDGALEAAQRRSAGQNSDDDIQIEGTSDSQQTSNAAMYSGDAAGAAENNAAGAGANTANNNAAGAANNAGAANSSADSTADQADPPAPIEITPDEVPDVSVDVDEDVEGGTISFVADSFSAYAIVAGPEPIPYEGHRAMTLEELTQSPFYLSHPLGYYFGNTLVKDSKRSGIYKIKPAQSIPPSNAALYYFEQAPGGADQFYAYCYAEDGVTKQYVYNGGNNSLSFTTQDKATAFTAQVGEDGVFTMRNGSWYWNMQGGENGQRFCSYNNATDPNNELYFWYPEIIPEDPYELDGKTYGLMNWGGGVAGKAMMGTPVSGGASGKDALEAKVLTVMATADNSDRLFVPNDSDIAMWTFHWMGSDTYQLTAVIDGSTKYLRIDENGVTAVSAPDENCVIKFIPGSGTHAGEICLRSAGSETNPPALTYTGSADTGFSVGGKVGSEWLHLVEPSELTTDYLMTYSAEKISVSDPSVSTGSRIIVYTRIWNDDAKRYELYAIDHDGTLVPVYDSGSSIEWVAGRLNTLLWNFVEYTWEGSDEPNYYYELYNQYSEQYIAPQVTDGQILSPDPIGINLSGRRAGRYYSNIQAWDEENYSYAGLKVENGKIVSCSSSEAIDFFFAVMQDLNTDDSLETVPTVDNDQHGITMRLVNFDTRKQMSDYLGSDAGGAVTTLVQGLLSSDLKDNGYPTAKGGSMSRFFQNGEPVNHLFLLNNYESTGYFEYDSIQNYASLCGQTSGDFTVYKEIASYDSVGGRNTLKHGQFFPYNDLEPGVFATINGYNLYNAKAELLPDGDPRKYERLYSLENGGKKVDCYFGMELEASFTQTPDGLDDWGHDIIFEFTGDDDFWLYVDGELVIDLGGIHSAVPGSVNFCTGQVNVNGKWTTLRDLFYNNYIDRGHTPAEAEAYVAERFVQNEHGQWIFKPNTAHSMRIFYLERGAGASNLHMRFNLASVRPGTVQLSKELLGVDRTESVIAEFPYQIYYKTPDGREHMLTNKYDGPLPPDGPDPDKDYVFYKDTDLPVPFIHEGFAVDGIPYDNVFLLKPDEVAEINFPENMTSYRIVECGINTDVYESVSANGHILPGTSESGYPENRKDYGIDYETTDERARVKYTNMVDPDALRTLTLDKKLFRENGVTPIDYDEDDITFSFQLSLASEFEELGDGDLYTYHVRDKHGNYCRWNTQSQHFESLGKSDYDSMTEDERKAASFTTSIYGTIAKIPTDHTVEFRHILAGTQFKVVERVQDIPDGYSFQKYMYNGEDSPATEAEGVEDTIRPDEDPHVDICNLKGWGLRMNKIWSDESYMALRDPTYFAVFLRTDEEYILIGDTVRQLKYVTRPQSIYWYFRYLLPGTTFDRYEIREVTLSNPNPTVDSEGVVTDYGTATPVQPGGKISLYGRVKGASETSEFEYTVEYEKGSIVEDSNVRTDTVTNDRPGLMLLKQDWNGDHLAGAVFRLEDSAGGVVGNFTSDEEGFITVAFLREGEDYTLTETKAPDAYHGLEAPMTIRIDDGEVTVEYEDESYYELVQGGYEPVLTIKDRPFTFAAVKENAESHRPLAGVKFALHREVTIDDVTAIDLNPMPGYEELVTGEDGTIPGIDNTLPAGTYELRELQPLADYQPLSSYIQFKITQTGEILLLPTRPPNVTLTEEIDEDGTLHYEMTIPNVFNPGVELPSTGGPGTLLLTLGGIVLIAGAALGLMCRRG